MRPKIRGIKPEFWTDEDIVELSIAARLLFIGMWNFACDNGHLDDKPKQIKMRIFPADDVDIDSLLEELVAHRRIERSEGTITVRRFAEHQKPHRRWWQTCDQPWCEVPDGATSTPPNRGATVAQPGNNGLATADVDVDVDVDVDGDRAPSAPARAKRGTRIPDDFALTEDMRRWAAKEGFGHLDLPAITVEFQDYWIGVPGAKGVKLDWIATWRNRVRAKAEDAKVRPMRRDQRPDRAHLPEAWR